MTKPRTVEDLIAQIQETSRCPGCDARLADLASFPARSRFRHGDLCSDCGRREAFEGDFITERILRRIALANQSAA